MQKRPVIATIRDYVSKRPRLMFFVVIWISALLWAGLARASEAQKDWLDFQKNTKAFMFRHPEKTDDLGVSVPNGLDSVFSERDIESGSFLEKKLRFRNKLTQRSANSFLNNSKNLNSLNFESRFDSTSEETKEETKTSFLAGEGDLSLLILNFLDEKEFAAKGIKPLLRLDDIDRMNLSKAKLKETPWSDTYWPIYQGILGARYASGSFLALGSTWGSYHKAVVDQNTLAKIIQRANLVEIDELSPSEKYDLLIGNPMATPAYAQGFLTPKMWSEGSTYVDALGSVEEWMGICHGWAPASFMVARPRTAVQVATSTGETGGVAQVKFYPSDIKGLTSFAWAKARDLDVHFLGERCNTKTAETDPETGRLLDKNCFDVNPGMWHLAVVNQIGQAQRGMVIDASYDYEVWNQPVYSYSYTYFNPQNGEPAKSAASGMVSIKEYKKDKFAKFRSFQAVAVVGVEMTLSYVSESVANHQETDAPENDVVRSVKYIYDLEIDAQGKVIGGEWYLRQHPDFMWLPTMNTFASSPGDDRTSGTWNTSQPLPKFWRDIAVVTAQRYGQPLMTIIDSLVGAANK